MELREACIDEAMAIIETDGVEKLSLREVSRRLGVSHQAPYKHFPSRDHILAAVVARAFESFAAHMDNKTPSVEPHTDLERMGRAYLDYALRHPLQYRLMFGTPLPDPADHPDMMASSQHAFSLLRDCITRMNLDSDPTLDALFVWSTMHGAATILQTHALDSLDLPQSVLDSATEHVMRRIGAALDG